ncbi:AAA domain-containing protein [Nocardia stercoris]|nr:AAA domain-containing protein [Nocardia stercoris]
MQLHEREFELIQSKAAEWAKALIQLDGRNGLLNFTITKTASLDLGESPDSAVSRLLVGTSVRLGELFPGADYQNACTRARNVVRRIRVYGEEQGVDVGRLVYGRVTTKPERRGGARPPVALRAPLLLYRIDVKARTAAETDFALQIVPDPELNPVLLYCLEHEYGVPVDEAEIQALLNRSDDFASPEQLVEKVFRLLADSASRHGVDLGLSRMVAVGICNYTKLPMVQDLMGSAELLAQHDLIALLAGCSADGQYPHADAKFEPITPDEVPPRDDHLVLDADSSQQRAIETAVARKHVVIDGPPGTGKSQTIANIIAVGAARGLKILFVAEKRAAIEAVTDRLVEIGLDKLVLDLHQASVSSKAVAAQLADSFEQLQLVPAVKDDDLDRRVAEDRNRLNAYVHELHVRRQPWDLSAFQVREHLIQRLEPGLRLSRLEQFSPDVRREVQDDLRAVVGNGGLRLVRRESPWWRAQIDTVERAREVLPLLDQVEARTLRNSQASMRALVNQVGLPLPRDLDGWDRTLALLTAMSTSATTLGGNIFRAPLDELHVATASWSQRRRLQPKISWKRRRHLLRELKQQSNGVGAKQQLHFEVSKVSDQLREWQRIGGSQQGPGTIGDLVGIGGQFHDLKTQLAALAMGVGVELVQQPLDHVGQQLEALSADRDMVPFLPDLNQRLRRLRGRGLDHLLDRIATANADPDEAVALFDSALMNSLEEEFKLTSQPLRDFQVGSHTRVLADFRVADDSHRYLAVQRVMRRVAHNVQQASTAHPDQSTLVRSEAKKKRGHRSLRRLVADASDVLLAVRPCWAMSPLVVSRSLPAEQLFDLVIFDEASQVQPHDAITSIMRGRHLVVAGDERQLPPTSFFDRLGADDGDDEHGDVQLGDYESILTALQPMIPNRNRLHWHYRSQDERLIKFSNDEIYGGQLVTFPGARVKTPVQLVVVDGRVEPGEQGSSDTEALRVVELILEHATNRSHESLGVITLGLAHQRKIDMALRRAREDRPELDQFFADDRGPTKRFFIKSIETVQGDERDAIILTVGVARNAQGRVQRNGFAVLNHEGTDRRINVAVTRARRRMTVVSSFPPGSLEPSERKTGTEMLRRYLEAAQRGGATAAVGRRLAVELNGFERMILDALVDRGVTVIPQWGVSGYRIDFALAHPDEPGRMVLAVEADGDSYHRAASARDRDRLRQDHLERLGWKFHRVWSSAWFANPELELERIIDAWKDAVAAECDVPLAPELQRQISVQNSEIGPSLPRPDVHPGLPITNYSVAQLVSMFRWRMSDGLLRDPEDRMAQVRADLGFQRRGKRIDASLRDAFERAQHMQSLEES